MNNRVLLVGRLVGDPELRYTPNGIAVAQPRARARGFLDPAERGGLPFPSDEGTRPDEPAPHGPEILLSVRGHVSFDLHAGEILPRVWKIRRDPECLLIVTLGIGQPSQLE